MTRRQFTPLAGLAAAHRLWSAPKRPNVLFILTDDQGFGDLSLHGSPDVRTPHMDSIARDGVRFTQFHSSPVCSPTRASLMTGRYNYRTGVVDTFIGRSMMAPDEVTMPETFRRAGYRTGIFGKWHLGDHYPMRAIDQGFDEALIHFGGGIGQPSDPPGGESYFDPLLEHNGKPERRRGYCTDIFFEEASAFIEQNRRSPFFAYIATNSPHTPLEVHEELADKYRQPSRSDRDARLYAMVENIDTNMGRLLDRLTKAGLARDTIVAFMTDNGPQWARYNSGMRGLKGTVYQGGIRVPLFLRLPGRIQAGAQSDRLAAHIDVFPTLAEACGVPLPTDRKVDGRSLWPLATNSGAAWPDRTLCFQWHRGDAPTRWQSACARNQRWKLVEDRELFDLEADPAESTNRIADEPAAATALRADYNRWFDDVCSTRGFDPQRIIIGSPRENPVMLSRQDWRGARAMGGPDALGHWELQVEQAGRYELRLILPRGPLESVEVRLGDWKRQVPLENGLAEARMMTGNVQAGPARLEAIVTAQGKTLGVRFAELRRI
jgi:arylsulfatase A-like enzyme